LQQAHLRHISYSQDRERTKIDASNGKVRFPVAIKVSKQRKKTTANAEQRKRQTRDVVSPNFSEEIITKVRLSVFEHNSAYEHTSTSVHMKA
jgi:hypothetical protein